MNRTNAVVCVLALACVATLSADQRRVAANSTVYIEPAENGVHTALAGALRKKKVPVVVVTSPDKAEYVISIVGEFQKAGWARTLMTGSRGDASASMSVAHRESGEVVYAYNVDKSNAARGIQSAAEACAKHLGNHIKGKE